MAEAATGALRALLGEGGVTIFNIGPDKYAGRVVADAAHQTHRKCFDGDARGGSCPQLRRRPSQRLVCERRPSRYPAEMKEPRK